MRKLCLFLTVLYAFGANCSAQSSLNIAQNLLEGNSSTFESGMGSWTCNGTHSIESTDGNNGKYLKLTDTGATNHYDKQMEYKIKDNGYPPLSDTKYVIKFWAKRNGNDGSGKIKVLLQKNESPSWPQQDFSNNINSKDEKNFFISIADTWTHYEYGLTTARADYEVIKISNG